MDEYERDRRANSNNIVDILIRRDGDTQEEAEARVEACKQAMEEVNYDPVEAEEILMEHLGLEPDYLFDLLFD